MSTNIATINKRLNLIVGETAAYSMTAPRQVDYLTGRVTWGKAQDRGGKLDPAKNVRVDITLPNGAVVKFDDSPSTVQTFDAGSPVPAGTYTVTLTNNGSLDLRGVTVEAALGTIA